MILFSVEAQQQLECVCEDGGQTESNHNIQDCSEVSQNLSPVERESVQFGHDCAGKNNINNAFTLLFVYSGAKLIKCTCKLAVSPCSLKLHSHIEYFGISGKLSPISFEYSQIISFP